MLTVKPNVRIKIIIFAESQSYNLKNDFTLKFLNNWKYSNFHKSQCEISLNKIIAMKKSKK